MEALCCKMSLTQAALPLLQELKRGVAPSVDTTSTYGGGNERKDYDTAAGEVAHYYCLTLFFRDNTKTRSIYEINTHKPTIHILEKWDVEKIKKWETQKVLFNFFFHMCSGTVQDL